MSARALRHGVLALLLSLGLVGMARAAEINLNRIFETVKGVAKSVSAATMSEADEIDVGKDIAARTLGAYPVLRDEALQVYVNTVGRWVALQSERPTLPWRFAVVQSEQINAFAVPGGAILITTGMFGMLRNEAELACVMGHEIGHVVRKHHVALLQKGALIETGTQLAAESVKGDSSSGLVKQYLVKEGGELFTRSLDRGAERDADIDSVVLAARAGYDPGACLSFMQRMASQRSEAGTLAALYKTHPQAAERVSDVEETLGRLDGARNGDGARPEFPRR